MNTLITLVIGSLFSYFLVTAIYNLFFHPLAHVPGPFLCRISGLPSFYHAVKGDRHVWFWQQFQLYGGKVRATPNLVVFNSPNAYNSIFSHKANVKRSKFYDAWSRNTDDVNALMTSDMELHSRKRRLLNLAFTDHSVKAASPFIAKHVDRWNELLLDSIEGKDDGWSAPRNVTTWTKYLVFDVLMDLCFGAVMDTKEPGENAYKKMPKAFDDFVSFNYPITKTPFLDVLVWLKPRGLDSLLDFVIPPMIKDHYVFVEDMVKKRLEEQQKRETAKTGDERQDMLHFLCSAKDPDTGEPAFGYKDLLAEANLLIMAGSDTTSITMSGLFFYLTHNQRVYRKLVKEVRDTFPDAKDIVHGPKLLTECKYLRACIDETLRLAPAGPSELPREVLPGGTTIDGEHFPAGVIVGTPNWAMGRNEEHYGDAYTFRPERWIASEELESLNPEEDVRKLRRGLHTFLKGPGDCVGQKLAMLQMSIVIARTLWRMDVRLAPGTDVGAGNAKLGWGLRNPRQYVLSDAYIALHSGPLVQVRARQN